MFIVTANSPEELDVLAFHQPDGIILALPDCSLRQKSFLNAEQLPEVVTKLHEKEIQVYLNALNMVMEEDLSKAEQLVALAAETGVDGMYVADECYIPLAQKYHILDRLIYQPETLIVNAHDARFYTDLGLQAVSLAHELSLEQICQIAAEADHLEVLIQGPYSWMYSRRPLISNYLREIGALPEGGLPQKAAWTIAEASRMEPMPVEEGTFGTVVYSAADMDSRRVIADLNQAGIERFRIDSLFHAEKDPGWSSAQLQDYRDLQSGRKSLDSKDLQGSDATYFSKTSLRKEDSHGNN